MKQKTAAPPDTSFYQTPFTGKVIQIPGEQDKYTDPALKIHISSQTGKFYADI